MSTVKSFFFIFLTLVYSRYLKAAEPIPIAPDMQGFSSTKLAPLILQYGEGQYDEDKAVNDFWNAAGETKAREKIGSLANKKGIPKLSGGLNSSKSDEGLSVSRLIHLPSRLPPLKFPPTSNSNGPPTKREAAAVRDPKNPLVGLFTAAVLLRALPALPRFPVKKPSRPRTLRPWAARSPHRLSPPLNRPPIQSKHH